MDGSKDLRFFIAIMAVFICIYLLFDLITVPSNRIETPSARRIIRKEKNSSPFLKDSLKEKDAPWINFVYPAQTDVRDPFRRGEVREHGGKPQYGIFSPPLILTGIIYNERNPIAILKDNKGNTYLARKGETVLGYTVRDILRRSVILRKMRMEMELKVFDEDRLLSVSKTNGSR
ncbi:MAG: hypothetical protein DRN29_10725 [Thermoplasmata archaeon]|nr:MAG: hypothetical protein DRN29_10725 [Thermoplasmata archaeon]